MGVVCSTGKNDVSTGSKRTDLIDQNQNSNQGNDIYIALFAKQTIDIKQRAKVSEEEAEKIEKKNKKNFKKEGIPFSSSSIILDNLSQEQKDEILNLIKENKLSEIHSLFTRNGFSIVEQLSREGFYWDILHFAVHYDKPEIVEYLLRYEYMLFHQLYKERVNATTREGWSAISIAICFKSEKSLNVLLNAGGFNLGIKDKDGLSIEGLANFYKNRYAIERLKAFERKAIAVNQEFLSSKSHIQYFESVKDKLMRMNENQTPNSEFTKTIPIKSNKCNEILQKCVSSQKCFVDEDFPHSFESLTKQKLHKFQEIFKNAIWKRPNEIFKCDFGSIQLFDEIDPNDVLQGSIGISYFLSIVSAIAEFPYRVKKIFTNESENSYGVYGVNFYFQGIPTEIIVDDYFPCFNDKLEPLFSKPNGKELWVMLLEKAWAKAFGCYTVVEYEVMDYAFEDILGAPSKGFFIEKMNIDNLWGKILSFDENDFIMGAISKKSVKTSEGIIPNHGYSIISAFDLDGGDRILKIRNPWGNYEWKGKYSEDSPIWTETWKKKVNFVNSDDGMFFMTIEEFHSKFNYFSVCYYYDDWVYTSIKIEREGNHSAYFKFKIDENEIETYLRIHQLNERLFIEKGEDYSYSSVHFSLYKKSKETGSYELLHNGANSKALGRKSVNISNQGKINLEKGDYLLKAKVLWNQNNLKEFVISTYSNKSFLLQEVKSSEGKKMMEDAYKVIGQTSPNAYIFSDGLRKFTYTWLPEHCVLYFENKSETLWNSGIKLTSVKNCRLGKKFKAEQDLIQFALGPNNSEVVLVKKEELSLAASFDFKVKEDMLE